MIDVALVAVLIISGLVALRMFGAVNKPSIHPTIPGCIFLVTLCTMIVRNL